MASINQFTDAAEKAGFVRTECVHEPRTYHIVFDYPKPLGNGTTEPFWRVHVNGAKVPHVTHISGTDTPEQRVSLKNAIDFMDRVTRKD